jgi:hypothetical protein
LFAARSFRETRIWLALLIVGLFVCAPFVARAQGADPAALGKITALNQKALDAYNNLEFEEARKLLKQALDLCGTAGLDKHPIKARTHVHMGVVLIAEKQQELGVKQFKKALDIQPDIQVTKEMANPEILQAFEEAGAGSGGGGGPEPGAGEPGGGGAATPAPSSGPAAGNVEPSDISHTPVSRARKGKAIPIAATVSPDLTGYTKVMLEYKPEGAPDYLEVEMRRSGNKFTAAIPSEATNGNRVAYYIDAEAADETTVASSASEEKPYYVVLAAGGRGTGDDGEEDSDDGGPRFFIGLLGGTGFGYTTGNGEVNAPFTVKAGFAPASLVQIAPEVGYFITPALRLSIQARYQYVSGTTPAYLDKLNLKYPAKNINVGQCGSDHICTSANYAIAVFAKGSWFLGTGSFRPYISGTLGGGQIRHVVSFTASPKDCGPQADQTCVDTVISGPVFAGPGVGAMFALTSNFGLVAEVNSVFGFPKFTFNLDLNAGIAARF